MRFLITDFKRSLSEPSFFASLALGIGCSFLSLFIYMQGKGEVDGLTLFLQSQSLILPFVAPLLAALPYANMSMLEADSGYKRLMMTKNNMKEYRFKRWFVSSIVSGIAVALPIALLAIVCAFIAPTDMLSKVFGILALNFVFGFSYGTICYGLTFVNSKRYIPTVTPQVIYLLFIYAFPYLGLEKYYPPLSFSPWLLINQVDLQSILVQFAVLNGIGMLLIVGRMAFDAISEMRG